MKTSRGKPLNNVIINDLEYSYTKVPQENPVSERLTVKRK